VTPSLDLVAIGRVSVDLYGQQVGSRLEDVLTFAKGVGGCPANVVIGAARLGLKSALITRVGDEPMGRFVREQLAREGVDTRGVRPDPARLTSLVLLSVRDAETFPLIFYRDNCADGALGPEDVDEELIAAARAVLVTGTHFSLTGGARAQRKAIEVARAHGGKVVLDVDYRPNLWGIGGHGAGESRYARSARVTEALAAVLPDCDLIVGTEEELHIAAGCEETLAAARRIRARSHAVIVCKRGPLGCVVFSGAIPERLEEAQVVPGMAIEVYNVLGAGDAFLAGFLLGYLRAAPHETSARYGNACGALAVSRLLCSAEFPTRRELEHYLAHGSRERALRADAALSHLHWVTAGRRGPPAVCALTVADPEPPTQPQAPGLGLLAVQAAAAVGSGREGYGVLLGRPDPAALREGQQRSLWLARRAGPVAQLIEWPSGITVVYRYSQAREPELAALAGACRAQGRELLLEVDMDGERAPRAEELGALMARVYALGVRPDWWALAAQLAADPAQRCAEVLAEHDRDCRGVLVTLEAAGTASSALAAAAGSSIVRGFIAGGSIFADVAAAWRSGQMAAESVSAAIAQRFRTLVDAWVRGGGH